MSDHNPKIVGTINVGDEPFFQVIDRDRDYLDVRFVYEEGHGLHLPKKLVRPLLQILKAYQDQRRHDRWPYVEEIRIETADKRVSIMARTRDLSESGLSIDSSATLPRGTELSVLLPPKKTQVKALAKVRNSREGAMGVEFVTVAPSARSKLVKMLEKARVHSVA